MWRVKGAAGARDLDPVGGIDRAPPPAPRHELRASTAAVLFTLGTVCLG